MRLLEKGIKMELFFVEGKNLSQNGVVFRIRTFRPWASSFLIRCEDQFVVKSYVTGILRILDLTILKLVVHGQ